MRTLIIRFVDICVSYQDVTEDSCLNGERS